MSCIALVHGNVGVSSVMRLDSKMRTRPVSMIKTRCVGVCVFVGVLQ
jgi:hypothetical protein